MLRGFPPVFLAECSEVLLSGFQCRLFPAASSVSLGQRRCPDVPPPPRVAHKKPPVVKS